ncbi:MULTISPECIES: DMT family transporter [unclassified Xanthobacter]|uniref:DMT family transporter n=1 Tax=unclassified Xanthobacter TaxID=2623496 RepID=UPI001EDD27EA|nr:MULTISPECIES: DMT family transporter [unclassified Xanthobacter]
MSSARSPQDAPLGAAELLLYVVTVLIFGTGWLPLRLQLGVVAPEVSGVWRFLVASAVMFAVLLITRGRIRFPWRDHLLFLAMGASLFSVNFVTFYHAGYYLPSGLLSVVFALAAVFIPLLSAVFFKVPLHPRVALGALAGVAGLALVFGPSIGAGEGAGGLGTGLMLSLVGTLSFSVGSLLSGVAARRGCPLASMNAWGFVYGCIIMAALAVARGEPFIVEWNVRYLGSLTYLVLAQTLVGFAAYLVLIRRIGPSRAGYTTVLFPLVALALSTVFEAFHWTLSAAAGIALVLAGALLVLLPRGRRPRAG